MRENRTSGSGRQGAGQPPPDLHLRVACEFTRRGPSSENSIAHGPYRPMLTAPRCCWPRTAPYGLSVTAACLLTPPTLPVTANTVAVVTPLLATTTVTLFAPAGTVTLAGRFSAPAFPLGPATAARLTLVPPAGAAPFRVAVSRVLTPPLRLAGENARLASEGAFTAREAA